MKILLVRLSSMGDLIHTLPAITDLSNHCTDIELHWLCEAAFSDIPKLNPFVKQVYEMSWRKWRKQLFQATTYSEMMNLKQQLKSQHYDLIIDSQGLLKSALFAKWGNAPIAGLDKHSARESLAAYFYQQRYAVQKGLDAVWRNRQLFASIFHYSVEKLPNFGVTIPDSVIDGLHNIPEQYYVALHSTSRDSKLWPLANWLAFLEKLYLFHGLPVLLPWGNELEQARAEVIASKLSFAQVCPKISLLQAAALLKKSQAVIGVDTGLLHLANAVNKPLVGIYTDSDPVKTGVQSSAWAKNIGGIGQIPTVDAVFDLLQNCLANKLQAA